MIVVETKKAVKHLKKIPVQIQESYLFWKRVVEHEGLSKLREIKSYHFEALKGARSGQHSCRLSKSYRVIFEIHNNNLIVQVLEVNKHEY